MAQRARHLTFALRAAPDSGAHGECQTLETERRETIMPNKPDPHRAAELAARLAQAYPAARPHLVARAVVSAVNLALYAKHRAELECSYPMTEENVSRAARRIERKAFKIDAELRAAVGASETGIGAPRLAFGGDPRGACGMLHIPGQDGDGWGRDGFPLY